MPGILIVEDDLELREMLRISMARKKYTVLEAENGREAILHFKPSVTDIVITDLIMPDEDGLKVIMKLRELKPSIKIIAISGGGKVGPGNYLNLAKALGANAVFSKPFSISDLMIKIDELLQAEQHD
ncbi:MAG TPA: response regulator [Bacteroidales bacterium]|nr:response regulator [Bacteroidales bacterium]